MAVEVFIKIFIYDYQLKKYRSKVSIPVNRILVVKTEQIINKKYYEIEYENPAAVYKLNNKGEVGEYNSLIINQGFIRVSDYNTLVIN